MSYKDFYIGRVGKFDQYSIDAEVVSKAVFDKRRITECYHRWDSAANPHELMCMDCKLTMPNERPTPRTRKARGEQL